MGAFHALCFPSWPRRVSRITLFILWDMLNSRLWRVSDQSHAIPGQSQTNTGSSYLKPGFSSFSTCFSIAVYIRVKCFPAYQSVFAQLLMHFYTSHNPSRSFVRRLGEEVGVVSFFLVPWPCFAPGPSAV